MRLFFALWPPAPAAAALARWAGETQRETGGRVTRPETIHLTLAFLGEVEDQRLQSALAAGQAVGGAPHSLPIDEARYWEHNRVVWVGPREMPAPLGALAGALRAELLREGFALEKRSFQAHVTLIRKARAPGALAPLPALAWPVEEFVLVRSELSSDGSDYEFVERFALAR
ncbi:MAG TPA: RNA 2',3'-cyclic phosphodiesterase [Burkholderiales bacterium]|nr:RNA 2',3'-cyclic phosphodiesterase [Burkholderiales bacterium]